MAPEDSTDSRHSRAGDRCPAFLKRSRGLGTSFQPIGGTILLMVQLTGTTLATTCVEATPTEALRAAAVVFRGRVVRTESLEKVVPVDRSTGKLPLKKAEGDDPYIATFVVDKVWKGPIDGTVQVFAFGRASMGGGFRFRAGVEYVVYAFDEMNQESPDIGQFSRRSRVYNLGVPCTLRVGTDVGKDSRALGPGKKTR